MPEAKFQIKRKCEVCGNTFIAKTLDSRYCCRHCTDIAYKKRKAAKAKEERLNKIAQLIPGEREFISISKESINLCLHIVQGRYYIQKILDDAEVEIYTERISWMRNPSSCHTIWHHWPDCILFVPYTCMMATGISCQPEY